MRRAYIFFNGELLGSKEFYLTLLEREEGDIYCADGGANLLEELGILPREIWGDLDSVSEEILQKYEEVGVGIKRFSKEKDFTDGELVLQYVTEKEYDKIVIIGGLGGRKDHELTNLNLIFKFKNLSFITEQEEIFEIERDKVILFQKGKTISFVPFSEKVEGLTLKGVKYPLDKYTLHRGDSICMSNIIEEDRCEISFEKGKLLGILVK
ncbi:thiamine diphosphokinase [Fusobacterium sp.]|uniref:thiamine diphosphokinase n=1 Tax=Fusobacterium sp. TaxID=68766 RepID=UPI0025BAB3A1|nr:thiamine diphosphokinase [Fusobacterium sp.]